MLEEGCMDIMKFVFAVYDLGIKRLPHGFKGFLKAGFTALSVSEEVVTFLVNNIPGFEPMDIDLIITSNYADLRGLFIEDD